MMALNPMLTLVAANSQVPAESPVLRLEIEELEKNRSALAELQGKLPVVTTASVMWIPEDEFLEYTSTIAQKLHDTQSQAELLKGENEALRNLVMTVRGLLAV